MVRTVVAITDLSDRSLEVLPHAQKIARYAGLELVLLHVVNAAGAWAAFAERAEAMVKEECEEKRKQLVERLAGYAGLLHVRVSHTGPGQSLAPAIVESAIEAGAVLMATTSRGESLLREALLGSTSTRLIRRSHIPVMVVGKEVEPPRSLAAPYSILFGVDGTPWSEVPAQLLSTLLSGGGPWRVLFQETGVSAEQLHPVDAASRAARVKMAARWLPREDAAGWVPSELFDSPEDIAKSLCEGAEREGADAIALASYEYKFLTRLFGASVGAEVLHRSKLPVIFAR